MRGVLVALRVGAVAVTLVPFGCNSSSGSGAADSGPCMPIDATIAASVTSAASGPCGTCVDTQCSPQVQACSTDCTCNDVSVTALACIAGLGGNASLSAAANCLAPLANSSTTGALAQLGQCLEANCPSACGAAPGDGGCAPADASLSALLDAGIGPCAACLQSSCSAAVSTCAATCACNAAAVPAFECLANLGAATTVESAGACVAPLIGAASLQLAGVGACLLDSCPTVCGVASDAGPADTGAASSSGSSSGSSTGGGSGSGGITGAGSDSGGIGGDGSAATSYPTGIAVDPAGYVFVAHSNSISVFSPLAATPGLALEPGQQATQSTSVSGGVTVLSPIGAGGIAVDGLGHLLVANYYETSVSSGCYFNPSAATPAYGSDVASYVDHSSSSAPPALSFNTILVGNPMNTELDAGVALECASGVAAAANGTVFVASTDGLRVFDGAGNLLASAPYPSYTNPNGIAFDPTSSSVYVTDSNNGVVDQYQFNPSGSPASALTLTRSITVQGDAGGLQPLNVAVDGNGDVYVSVLASTTIYVYSATGAALAPIGITPPSGSVCSGLLAFDAMNRLYLPCGDESVGVYAQQSGGTWQLVGSTP